MNILLILYYFFPQIDLVTVPISVTGLRFSDLLCVVFLYKFLVDCRKFKCNPILFNSYLFLVFFCAACVSVYNSFSNGFGYMGIVVLARYVQYLLVGYYTYVYFVRLNNKSITIIYFITLFLAILQFFELIPNYNPGKNGFLYSSEFSSSYGTPAEHAYFFALLPFLLRTNYACRLGIFMVIFNALNGVKGALALIIPLVTTKKQISYVVFILIFLVIIIGPRIDELNRFLGDILYYYNGHHSYTELKAYKGTGYIVASLADRVGKWGIALSLVSGNLWSFFFGYGLYAAKGALDGGLVRIFFEHGMIGLLCVSYFVSFGGLKFIFIFLVSNLMFDAYLSSIASPLLLAIYFKQRFEYRVL